MPTLSLSPVPSSDCTVPWMVSRASMQNVEFMELMVIIFNVAESVVISYSQKILFQFRIVNNNSAKGNLHGCARVMMMMIYFGL